MVSQNRIESWAHRAMGFFAILVNLRLLLTYRELRQLPPENDANPVIRVAGREYWSKARVMDTLNDSREYDEGGTAGWFFLVLISFAAGYWSA